MHGVAPCDAAARRVDGYGALRLIAVGVHHQIAEAVGVVGEAEDGGARASGHLDLYAFVKQDVAVVGRGGAFVGVVHAARACFGRGAE